MNYVLPQVNISRTLNESFLHFVIHVINVVFNHLNCNMKRIFSNTLIFNVFFFLETFAFFRFYNIEL